MSDPRSIEELRNGFLNCETPARSGGRRKAKKTGTGRRFATLNWFNDTQARGLSIVAQVVWDALFRDARNDIAQLSHQQIADARGISRRSAQNGITELVEKKLVKIVTRGGPNRETNRYRLMGP